MITKVSDNLYRGPRPKSQADIDELKALGVKLIINLEWGAYEWMHNDFYERWSFGQNDFSMTHIICSDFTPPEKDQVRAFLLWWSTAMKLKSNTYVHCLHGKDRTGFMCAAYRIKVQKWSYWKAVREMLAMGFHWVYLWWIPFLWWRTR